MSIIGMFKSLSKQLGVYNAIRYSKAYHEIMKYKNPGYILALNEDLAFYRNALDDSPGLIFDVGANYGDKTWALCQIAQRIVCFEPDETCFSALCSRYRKNKMVNLEKIALGEKVGVGVFYIEEQGSAYNTLNKKERDWIVSERKKNIREVSVSISTLDKMFEKYGIPDFIKIDVEGGEVSVFKGLSRSVPIICFEANLPRFREETISIIDRFSVNNLARFNLRLENNFVFPVHKPAKDIISVLNRNEEVSYDIFIYNEK